MPTSRPRRPVEVGITGGVAVTAGLALVVFGIVRARSWAGRWPAQSCRSPRLHRQQRGAAGERVVIEHLLKVEVE